MDKLSTKSQSLESELERKSEQLKEVAARAADEAEKSQAAKEVIKSLTAQVGFHHVADMNLLIKYQFFSFSYITCIESLMKLRIQIASS